MNYSGRFDATFGSEGRATHSHAYVHVDSSQTHAPAGAFIVPDAQLLFHGDFRRAGNDLILSSDHREFVVHDYFRGEKRAAVASPDGAHLTADIIKALVGEVDVSQAGNAQPASQVIGHVTKLQGSATVIRNGVSIILNMGDNVEKGDVVQSGSNSTLGITFIDGTVFGLSSNARMVLNEMVYDPNGSNNSSLISLVAGTISFVAGETAKHGDMKVDTPVATMGIRGTAVLVEIDFTVPGTNQSPQQAQPAPSASFQVLVEPDGTTGSYILFDKTTLQPIAIVNQAGQQININNGIISQTTTPLSPDVQKLINDVFTQKFTDNSNSNTKTTTAFTDSIIPTSNGLIFKLADGSTATTVLVTGSGSLNAPPPPPGNTLSHIPGTLTLASLGFSGTQTAFSTAELTGKTGDIFDFASVGGTFHFQDINVADRPTVKADFASVTYTNANGAFTMAAGQTAASGLSALQSADVLATAIKLFMVPSAGNTNNGDVTWIYALRDNAFDFLAAGETLTFTYHVTANSNYLPAPETQSLDVTVTITGTNDKPVITTGPQTISFAAGTTTPGGNLPTHDPTSGTLAFTDVDLTDKHTVSKALTSAVMSNGGTIPISPEQLFESALTVSIGTDSTGTGKGVVNWQFADLPVYVADFIPAGEKVTLTYTVTVTDSSGDLATDSTTQTITVVIGGTEAAAEVWIHTTTDGHDNLWTTGQNWETGNAPVSTDDVIIITDQLHPNTPAYPALIDQGTAAVAHSVTMNDFAEQSDDPAHVPPELDVACGASLTIGAGGLSVSADSIVSNHGTVTVGGAVKFGDDSALWNYGLFTLLQGGDFTDFASIKNAATGTIEIAGGTLNVTVDIDNCGDITVDGGATMTINGATVHGGAVTVTEATVSTIDSAVLNLLGTSFLEEGTLDNAGQVNVGGDVTFDKETVINCGGAITVTVTGTLTLDDGTTIYGGDLNIGSVGVLKVSSVDGATLDGVTVNVDSAGVVQVDPGSTLTLNETTISGGTINDGTATHGGTIDVTGDSEIDDSATLSNGAVTVEAKLTLDDVTISGTTITDKGSIELDHTVKLTDGATIAGLSADDPGAVTNDGTLDVAGTATLLDVSLTNHGGVTVDNGQTLHLEDSSISGGSLGVTGTLDSTGTSFITGATIDNLGNIQVSGGTLTIDPAPVTNSGTILATNGGTLVLDGETINNGVDGTIQVDADASHVSQIDLEDSTINGGFVVVSGVLDSTGDSFINGATIDYDGTIDVLGGTLTIDAASILNNAGAGLFEVDDGKLVIDAALSGSLEIKGASTLELGTAEDLYSNATVTFDAGSTGTLMLDRAEAFQPGGSGLTVAGLDDNAIDLLNVAYGSDLTVVYSGNELGGTLSFYRDGHDVADVKLTGDYLGVHWVLADDGSADHGTTISEVPGAIAELDSQQNAVEGQQLTVSITDGGATVSAAHYDWQVSSDGKTWQEANGINGLSSYTPVEADEGQLLKVDLTFTDATDHVETSTVSAGTVQESPTENASIALSGLTSGNAVEGQQITAVVTEPDAPASGITYTWKVGDTVVHSGVDANGATYTPTEDDEGNAISVSVAFTDTHGFSESGAQSAGTVQESPTENASIALSGLTSGNAVEGQQITAVVTEPDAPASGITYTWKVGDTVVQSGVDANGATYTPTEDDEGKAISVSVAFTDTHGFSESGAQSAGTVQESPTENALIALSGLTSGNAVEGQQITAVVTEPDAPNSGITYTWTVNGATVKTGVDAAGNTYTPTETDEGKAISVSVSFTDTHGFGESGAQSAGMVQESPTENASVQLAGLDDNGNAVQGQKVTATVTESDAPPSGITYTWKVNGTTVKTGVDAVGNTYTPTESDEGKTISVSVSFTDMHGFGEHGSASAGTVQEQVGGDLVATLDHMIAQEGVTIHVTGVTDGGNVVQDGVSYKWQTSTNGGLTWTTVGTSSSFTPGDAQEGKLMQLVVSHTEVTGTESVTYGLGVPTDLAATLDAATAQQGLPIHVTSVTDGGNSVSSGVSYAWQTSSDGHTWTTVDTDSSYVPTASDAGDQLQLVVTYADQGEHESVTKSLGVVAAAKEWNTNSTGTWETSPKWALPGVPGSADNAVIDASGTQSFTLKIDQASSAHSLVLNSSHATVEITGDHPGSLTLGGNLTIDAGHFQIDSGGSLNVNAASSIISGSFTDNGTVEVGAGDKLEVASTTISGTGVFKIDAGATLQIDHADSLNVVFSGSGTLVLAAPTHFQGTVSDRGGSMTSADVLDLKGFDSTASVTYNGNGSGGTLTISEFGHTAAHITVGANSTHWTTPVSDGQGGILIHDPPAPDSPPSTGQTWAGDGFIFKSDMGGDGAGHPGWMDPTQTDAWHSSNATSLVALINEAGLGDGAGVIDGHDIPALQHAKTPFAGHQGDFHFA